jgi:amidase
MEEITRAPSKLTIAWSSETPTGNPIATEVQAAIERSAETLRALGHEVREEGLGIDWRALYRAQGAVSAANFAAGMARWIEIKGREPGDDIEGLARRLYERGKAMSGQDAMTGWQKLRVLNRQVLALFERVDVFLSPVLCTTPPRVDYLDTLMPDLREFDKRQAATFGFTPPFNMTGQPSLSLPLWQSEKDGLPIAMMFTAKYADEATLFRLAAQLEKELPWAGRKPAVWN